MKNIMNLENLVQKLQNQNLQKHDVVVPSTHIKFVNNQLVITGMPGDEVANLINSIPGVASSNQLTHQTTEWFNRQIAGKMEIPMQYFNRMLESQPSGDDTILDKNINHWLSQSNSNYLIRTLVDAETGLRVARAFLGDRYRMLDNIDILFAALDAVRASGTNVQIESCDLTDTRMYVRFIAPDVVIDAPELLKNYRVPNPNKPGSKPGDTGIHAGFILSNSETGHGATMIAPRLIVNACTNGMIMKADAQKQVHLGGRMAEFTQIDWSNETREKNIELIISQIRDAVKHYLTPEYLGAAIDSLVDVGTKQLDHPIDAIANVAKELQFSEDKQKQLLQFFMQGGDNTGFGVTQAITYFAHEGTENADERLELETVAIDYADAARYDKKVATIAKRARKTMKTFSQN